MTRHAQKGSHVWPIVGGLLGTYLLGYGPALVLYDAFPAPWFGHFLELFYAPLLALIETPFIAPVLNGYVAFCLRLFGRL
jgi:hypothetical protein